MIEISEKKSPKYGLETTNYYVVTLFHIHIYLMF